MRALALACAVSVLAPIAAGAQGAAQAHILDLSCIEALAAVGQQDLAGIFSYIPDNDTAAAFADLLAHKRKALRKFLNKAEKDVKDVSGISDWDHDAAAYTLEIYSSPAVAATVEKPSSSDLRRLQALVLAPKLSLEEMTARRNAKR